MKLPRITIITPTYNQGSYIEQTIQSVLCQGYPNLEYIVMDGGSTDQTIDILRRYEHSLHWISERDRGQSHAINKAMRMASGDIVAFLNSDDLYEPGALQAVGEFFAQNPQAAWLTGKCRIIDPAGNETRRAITSYKNAWLRLNSRAVLMIINYISQPATFWRRELIEQVGLFDEELHYAFDYDYWLRIGQQVRLKVLDQYLSAFRVHPASKGGTAAQIQFDQELVISQRYTSSRLLRRLHHLHKSMILGIYRRLAAVECARQQYSSKVRGGLQGVE